MTRRSITIFLGLAAALLRCSSFSSSPDSARDAGAGADADAPLMTDDAGAVDTPDEGAPVALPAGCDPTCPHAYGACGVRVGPSCVDATEVTIGDWRVFASASAQVDAGVECGIVQPAPLGTRPDEALPITDVTFCEARAYCSWAGKALCGGVGGSPLTLSDPLTQRALWYNACTGGSTSPENLLTDAGCNLATPTTRAARTTCQGGVAGLFDMVGNVSEWIEVVGASGQSFNAVEIGSSFDGAERDTCQTMRTRPTTDHASDLGFRCCSAH